MNRAILAVAYLPSIWYWPPGSLHVAEMGKRANSTGRRFLFRWHLESLRWSLKSKRCVALEHQEMAFPLEWACSWVRWCYWPRRGTFVCSCGTAFWARNASCDILAHVLWLVYRHRVLFSRSREPSTEISAGNRAPATTIPRVTARRSAFVLGCPAVVTADLLGCPNSVHQCA